MPRYVYFSQADSNTFVTETVASLKERLKVTLEIWVNDQGLADAGVVLNLITHAMQSSIGDVGMTLIKQPLTAALNEKKLSLIQRCYQYHRGKSIDEPTKRSLSCKHEITRIDAEIQEARRELVEIRKAEERQSTGFRPYNMGTAQVSSFAWGGLHDQPAPTASLLTSKIENLQEEKLKLEKEVELIQKFIDDKPSKVESLDKLHVDKVGRLYGSEVDLIVTSVLVSRSQIERSVRAASEIIYLDALDAKLKREEKSDVTSALGGIVFNLRKRVEATASIAVLQEEQEQLEARICAVNSQIQIHEASLKNNTAELDKLKREQQSTLSQAENMKQRMPGLYGWEKFYRAKAISFAVMALTSALVTVVWTGFSIAMMVLASTITLCLFAAALRAGWLLRVNNTRINDTRNTIDNLEGKSDRGAYDITALKFEVRQLDEKLALLVRKRETAEEELKQNGELYLKRQQEKLSFFHNACVSFEPIVASSSHENTIAQKR